MRASHSLSGTSEIRNHDNKALGRPHFRHGGEMSSARLVRLSSNTESRVALAPRCTVSRTTARRSAYGGWPACLLRVGMLDCATSRLLSPASGFAPSTCAQVHRIIGHIVHGLLSLRSVTGLMLIGCALLRSVRGRCGEPRGGMSVVHVRVGAVGLVRRGRSIRPHAVGLSPAVASVMPYVTCCRAWSCRMLRATSHMG
jgi:hypothetical protein